MADQLLLVGQAQPAGGSSAGDDERLRVHLMHAEMKQERTLAEVRAGEMRHAVFRAEAFRLLAHVLDQLRSHDSFGEAGKIFHQRGERKLAAGLVAFDHKRLQIGAGGVKRGSVSGAAGTDDDDVASFAHDWLAVRLRISDFDALPCCERRKARS